MSEYITKDWLSSELQKVHSVVIYVNSAFAGVKVPASLSCKPSFTLQLSHHFDRPMVFRKHDLKADFLFENGFEACSIPWNSVWAAHPDGCAKDIVFWNQNSPGTGWDKALCEFLKIEPKADQPVQAAEPPQTTSSENTTKTSAGKKERSRSHLKLVK